MKRRKRSGNERLALSQTFEFWASILRSHIFVPSIGLCDRSAFSLWPLLSVAPKEGDGGRLLKRENADLAKGIPLVEPMRILFFVFFDDSFSMN